MHPNRRFAWEDREEMLAFVREIAFCTICVGGPMVAHAPVVVCAPDRLRFHVSRANRAAAVMDGGSDGAQAARAVVSCLGPDAYVSPDWYGTGDQVPTWNYLAVEAEGPLRRLDDAELIDLLDTLSAEHETRLAPKPPWTRAKMSPGRFEGLLKAIIGFELTVEALRGTRKLGQHKRETERASAAEGLAPFHPEMARLMRESSSPREAGGGDPPEDRQVALSPGQGCAVRGTAHLPMGRGKSPDEARPELSPLHHAPHGSPPRQRSGRNR